MNNTFQDFPLSQEILTALTKLQYAQPTEVQTKVIPLALEKRDLVVKSQTGSGKTASFAIPLCEMVEWGENKPQALVLTPTRELAVQVKDEIENIGRYKRTKALAIYGKSPFDWQKLELKQKTHIVVGTPRRVLDHIQKGTFPLERLQTLVIDEADEMLNMGFIEQVEAIINELPTERVTMLFSATLPSDVEKLCSSYMKEPLQIEINATEVTTEKIDHSVYVVTEEKKFALLKDLSVVENPDSCIIFCRTKENVDKVYEWLDKENYPCDKLHGGLEQWDRFAVMNDFKSGEFRYLVATDVAARGIDIEAISLVINYDVPLEKEVYVHRTGRTGRAGKSGKAMTFVTPYEDKFLEAIEEYIGFEIPHKDAPAKEEVEKCRRQFNEKLDTLPPLKHDKRAELNQGIMKLYFNGGKKKKLRAVDFVGTIAKINGVNADDIGIITIQDNATYVDILHGKGPIVLKEMKHTTIKGKLLKVHQAKK